MRHTSDPCRWPNWSRRLLIGLAVLLLTSCRSAAPLPSPALPVAPHAAAPATTPATTLDVAPAVAPAVASIGDRPRPAAARRNAPVAPASHTAKPSAAKGSPAATVEALPAHPARTLPWQAYSGLAPSPAPWRPPGIGGLWPADEYLCDGGVQGPPVVVRADGAVLGLNPQDAVAHFDTLDGRTLSVPTNKVCIYAPRFASVRQVARLTQAQMRERVADAEHAMQVARHDELQPSSVVHQPIPLGSKLAARGAAGFRQRDVGAGLGRVQQVDQLRMRLMAYEDFQVVRTGDLLNSDKPRLADSLLAARAWSHEASLRVLVDGQQAHALRGDVSAQEIVVYESKPGVPGLRVIKLASTKAALPGDVVHFTIRFDNVGTEVIGNVTILDSLVTRLEYVADSAQASRDAEFFTEPNEAESLVLRWELVEPLEPGDGGIIRFQARVR